MGDGESGLAYGELGIYDLIILDVMLPGLDGRPLPALRSRLRAMARADEHGENGAYRIRSLYFDTPTDRALREKIDGVARREKFRLRRYGGGSLIRLEKKSKLGGLCAKEQAPVTEEEIGRVYRPLLK